MSSSPDTTILPIITQQRDRFRVRNAELEEDLRKRLTLVSSLRGEIQALKTDNLGLYEKVRYLQHFTKNAGSMTMGNGDVVNALLEEGGVGASGSERPGGNVGMERYRAAYEESMTPFEAFRGKVTNTSHILSRQGARFLLFHSIFSVALRELTVRNQ
jgi:homeobox protein cut-like